PRESISAIFSLISLCSSMISMLRCDMLMNIECLQNYRLGFIFHQFWQCEINSGSFSQFTLQRNISIQKVNVSFYDRKTQTCAFNVDHIFPPEKCCKQMVLIFLRYSYSFVP